MGYTPKAISNALAELKDRIPEDHKAIRYVCPKCGSPGAIRMLESGSGRLVSHLCLACGLVKPEVERMV